MNQQSLLDLRPLLESWRYEEGRNIRRVSTPEGRDVIQVRLPLGLEQYEINGRPDGLRPAEMESWYHYYSQKADRAGGGFLLGKEALKRLQEECMLYYQRYLLFFQISEYRLCARDTLRNLQVLDFVSHHADPTLSESLEQYRPYILRMHVMARTLQNLQTEGDVPRAMRFIRDGMTAIESLDPLEDNSVFELEKARSLESLQDLYRQLESHVPRSPLEVLQDEFDQAVETEDYEEAARLRDEIARLREEGAGEE